MVGQKYPSDFLRRNSFTGFQMNKEGGKPT